MNKLYKRELSSLPITFEHFSSIPSTSLYLKDVIKEGRVPADLVIADFQTAGQGRNGKNFYSPSRTGLYLTFSFPVKSLPCEDLTPRVALAAARAIDHEFSTHCGIKWVNDIYLDSRKVAGILCQRVEDFFLIGIGVNVEKPDFVPDELFHRFGSLVSSCDKAKYASLAKRLYLEILSVSTEEKATVLSDYRDRIVHFGRMVEIEQNGKVLCGVCKDVADDFSLVLDFNGEEKRFTSGFMTLKIERSDC